MTILAETDDYVVVDKPAGIVVHQGQQHPQADTLANALVARYPEIADVGEDPQRPGIVHRLDQDVSGVMVVARTQAMFEHLKLQFQQHLVKKVYIALVHGKMTKPDGEIRFSIARSEKQFTKMAARPDASGKEAITKYTVMHQYQRYALLEVEILTGRTHQIRVHLNAIGHPLVGEQLYKPKKLVSRLQPGRVFLHSSNLGFCLPDGTLVGYNAPLPDALQTILDGLY